MFLLSFSFIPLWGKGVGGCQIHIHLYVVSKEFVCLSATNFDPNYLRTGRKKFHLYLIMMGKDV